MLVLGIDTETTGLDVNKDLIVELGAVLFSVDENGSWTPQIPVCHLIKDPHYPPMPPEATAVNGITQEDLDSHGIPFDEAYAKILPLVAQCEMIVAHNKNYDKKIILSQVERFGLGVGILEHRPWICSAEDLETNKNFKCWKLSHLALDRGVAVDPKDLHRATDDIMLMGKMLTAAKADPKKMYEYSVTPEIVLQAQIPAPWTDNGVGKAHAQALGYGWEKVKGSDRQFQKLWVKKIKENELDSEIKKAPFTINNLGRL